MTDLISRADAIEAVLTYFIPRSHTGERGEHEEDFVRTIFKALPSADVSRIEYDDRVELLVANRKKDKVILKDAFGSMEYVPSADAEQTDCTDFVNWLTEVVMDEGNWELNAVAYGEIICRKLEKLGVLEVTEEPSYYIRPSAEPTVIRSKTLLPTKDFKEWAKRVRETNPNAVVIPCDAEVVSADAVSREFYEDAVKANIGIVIENRKLKAQIESADAVQGEWIEVEDYNGDVHYKCDQCGEEWTFPYGTPEENNANFCPNCGANMKGGAK